MLYFTKIAIVTTALASVGAVAFAAKTMENDAAAGPPAKVSLVQAIAAAEQHQAGGKATRAEYEKTRAGWVYDVEIVSGAKVFDVRVDADKGTVVSSAEDTADRDDDHDKTD